MARSKPQLTPPDKVLSAEPDVPAAAAAAGNAPAAPWAAADQLSGVVELFLMAWRRVEALEARLQASESRRRDLETWVTVQAQVVDQHTDALAQHARLIDQHSDAIQRLQGSSQAGVAGEEPPAAITIH